MEFLTRVAFSRRVVCWPGPAFANEVGTFSRLSLRSLQSPGVRQSWHDLLLRGNLDGGGPCLLLEIIIKF